MSNDALWSEFVSQHIGPDSRQVDEMLNALQVETLDQLIDQVITVPVRPKVEAFRSSVSRPLGKSEQETLQWMQALAAKNTVLRSFAGCGYYDTITPAVIERTIFTNPSWYTQYTPYQAEIAQGRLEALLNFQTMVTDLVALPFANASLLDEATASGEAMGVMLAKNSRSEKICIVDRELHPQTLAYLKARAAVQKIELRERTISEISDLDLTGSFGVITQNPGTSGVVRDLAPLSLRVHNAGALLAAATDLLACCLVTPPGEMGVDIAFGSAQRFGVPLGFGGPHAAFFAVTDDLKRLLPGRLVGVSKDRNGNQALRLSLQTREQHIRREKATSNICTAQVLLAIMASMYAVYCGPRKLAERAKRVAEQAGNFAVSLEKGGYTLRNTAFFDTVEFICADSARVFGDLLQKNILVRQVSDSSLSVAFDETSRAEDVDSILAVLGVVPSSATEVNRIGGIIRTSQYLSHPVFNQHHSETQLLRYIKHLEVKDLSLAHSMIPLGSCTMKLNSAVEMKPVSFAGFSALHPLTPAALTPGYNELFAELEFWLKECTGFDAVSLQPNSGAQGEYAGLLTLRQYLNANDKANRTICLIPTSAHGTNPASAVIAGFEVVQVACDAAGNIDVSDLQLKIELHRGSVGALMITYPSTHGVFESKVANITQMVHDEGGLVYMDGANFNALVGLLRPVDIGADVCHINLHKTFCIPHGGGGPGMGPIACREFLKDFLPNHPFRVVGGEKASGPVAAAPFGSASILPISVAYMTLMGFSGLKRASEIAILNANYLAAKLQMSFPILYRGEQGRVAHECILDIRALEKSAGIKVEDIAKRLIDYGFHAPTVSWPVAGTLMIEPTESESKDELDRFIDAMISIRAEISAVESGVADKKDNLLSNAPHTVAEVTADEWTHPYSRTEAAFPRPWVRDKKFWPAVARIDNVYGDRNLMCTCSW